MRRNRLLLSGIALAAAVSTATIIPVSSASAATNGLTIRTLTKNVVQGDTGRIKGKIVSGKAGVKITIQQRSPETGKDWGSGRTVTTDKNGKWQLDRVIKGQFTRDYRACVGTPGKRSCSLRARIQVVPRVVGILNQTFPAFVDAGSQLTVRAATDSVLAGRTVELQQLNPANLKFYTIGTAVVSPNFTVEVSGTPLINKVKGATFRLSSPAFAGRSQVTVSSKFQVDVYGYVSLTDFPAVSGGYTVGAPVQEKPGGATETIGSVTAGTGINTFTIRPAAACNRFTAQVFVANTAGADDAMNTSVAAMSGTAAETVKYAEQNIRRGDALRQVDVRIDGATELRITQNVTAAGTGTPPADGATMVPVWYGVPTLSCAY